uniref:SDE2 telomere maintenance homolog (S. pombe) n=1 Tax=Astyanax mexicanus TaxID=7994 RepID=W5L2K6_ASTMX
MDVSVVSPAFRCVNLSVGAEATVRELRDLLASREGIPSEDCYVSSNGRISDQDHKLQAGAVYRLELRLCGGKGGFGSMLRALGAQIEKTTNREACRDLSGRRLRDVNHEKEMADWLKKQADREAEKEQRRLERIQRKLAEPKHYFTDIDYEQQCHDLSERLEDSVLKGMQASSSGVVQADEGPSRKRPAAKDGNVATKKKCFWTGVGGLDDMDSSEGDSDEGDEAEDSPSTSASVSGASCISETPGKPAASSRGSEKPEVQQEQPSSSCSSSSSSSPAHSTPSQENEAEEITEEPKKQNSSDGQEVEDTVTTNAEGESCSCPADSIETPAVQPVQSEGPLDLLCVSGVEDLVALGLERLKEELMQRGMKCGGTLQERAARLFSVKGLSPDQIDPALLAKPSKGKKK